MFSSKSGIAKLDSNRGNQFEISSRVRRPDLGVVKSSESVELLLLPGSIATTRNQVLREIIRQEGGREVGKVAIDGVQDCRVHVNQFVRAIDGAVKNRVQLVVVQHKEMVGGHDRHQASAVLRLLGVWTRTPWVSWKNLPG